MELFDRFSSEGQEIEAPAMNRFIGGLFKLPAVIVPLFLSISAFADPPAGILDDTHAAVQAVMAVQGEVTPDLMRQPGILGTAVGVDAADVPVLTVYVDRDAADAGKVVRNLPRELRGVGLQVQLTDKFRAMAHIAKQTPPIQLGTSGGWTYDLANGFCCGGTLGSLVKIGSTQYILSNYHVLEADIVSGGNSRIAQTGDPIIQPGLIDVNCSANGAQTVGTLIKKSSLPGSNVDCAIAQVVPGMVRTDGAILEIGTISNTTVGAFINQAVKKSGRTTGLTHSSVSGLNATVSVTYDNECAGGTAFTKVFTGQIVVANSGNHFLNSGDSGSLMVEDVATKPRAVGLLFAGNSTTAIANPIGQVLAFLGATMVGGGSNRSDFNGDGKSDILWQNTSTGQRLIWIMNGITHTATVNLGTVPTSWSIAGSGDFNGDGKADILWQNTSTGQRLIWIMNGITHTATVNLETVPTPWSIVGSSDFNGDGKADILWQNTSTGQRLIWIMNGTAHVSNVNLGFVATSWSIAGSSDFNGDGKPDILWQNSASGQRIIWIMNGLTHTATVNLGFVATSWSIAGSGDFNGDGKADILWQNTSTGQRLIWIMNGTAHVSNVNLGFVPTSWSIRNY
jgi:FG-GAP-like repeat